MTSANFRSYAISEITVLREDRQRRHLVGVDELSESIQRIGLINPIVITDEGILVAGERRLTACRSLGWTHIPAQLVSELSDYELQCIELEENTKRVNLTWQEECAAIEKFHGLKSSNEANWTTAATADALGLDRSTINEKLAVAKAITEGNERIAQADKFSVARNLVARENERRKTSALEKIDRVASAAMAPKDDTAANVGGTPTRTPPILLADFHEWQAAYTGPRFNLIHCDFPYGINVASGPRQNSSIAEHYDDSPDIYWSLMGTFASAMENVVADSAHLLFWFSMHYYSQTLEALSSMGWSVDPFPLIWHKSDNAGVAPDPQRRLRRTYETAFFASRGDRKLTQVGARSASFAFPGKLGDEAHMSAKPVPMLSHFLASICDEYSTVLDPTCGSGNALKACEALGANSVLGLEISEDFYTLSCRRYYD